MKNRHSVQFRCPFLSLFTKFAHIVLFFFCVLLFVAICFACVSGQMPLEYPLTASLWNLHISVEYTNLSPLRFFFDFLGKGITRKTNRKKQTWSSDSISKSNNIKRKLLLKLIGANLNEKIIIISLSIPVDNDLEAERKKKNWSLIACQTIIVKLSK